MGFSPRRKHEPELLDQPARPDEIEGSLRDLQRVNRFLGGCRPTLRFLAELARSVRREQTLRVLDVATGPADTPRRVVEWARRQGRRIEVTATDTNPEVLRFAREWSAGYPEVRFARCDARELPFPDHAFEVALCSLTLHQFEPPEAVRILREMARVSRLGIIASGVPAGGADRDRPPGTAAFSH